MHYVAWRISEGAVPYRDVFDMNFPGAYVIHLGVVRGLGPGDGAWRVFDLGWLALSGGAIAALAAPWGLIAALGGAVVFAVHHLAAGPWQTGQRDFLLCLFLVLGALGVARWLERARLGELAWSGVALGAGVTIKPHAALFAVALAVVIAVRAAQTSNGVVPAVVFLAGVAAAPTAIVAWLGTLGALPAWRAIVFDYLLPLYSRLGRPASWGFYRWSVWLPLAVAVVVSLAAAVRARRFTPRHLVAALGLAYGIVHYFGQGKGWEYHVYPAAAFAAVLAVSEIDAAARARRWVTAVPIAAALLVTVILSHAKGVEAAAAAESGWISDKMRLVDTLVAELRPRLRAGDRVQVFDTTEGGIHALLRLGVAEPTRFIYDFHFFHDTDAPEIRALRAELIRDLAARPPRVIMLFRRGWPTGGYERFATFPELARWLRAEYRSDGPGPDYVIYEKRDGS